MSKIAKLKEVNTMLKSVLVELEARMFIENVDGVRDKIIQEEKPQVLVELKQQV